MNSLLIHISGHLSAEMGSELYLKIKESSLESGIFCLSCNDLASLDEVGAEYLCKIQNRLIETASKLALSGLPDKMAEAFSGFGVRELFPAFPSSEEAKLYLEAQLPSKQPANESNSSTSSAPIEMDLPKSIEINFILCPTCGQKLKFNKVGDHSCPACKTRFAVNRRGWVSKYEKLI